MADELTKVELFGANNDGQPIRYDIAASAAITKGALLGLLDPRTASSSILHADKPLAGVAAVEKDASDGTDITLWTQGIFEGKASGAITAGNPVTAESGNLIREFDGASANGHQAASLALIIGRALETASDGEIINFRLNL